MKAVYRVSVVLALAFLLVAGLTWASESLHVLEVWRSQAAAREAAARAQEYEEHARLVVAEGEAQILQEAARAVASDRRLVTLYALSGNVLVLGGVLLGGLVAGVLVARGRRAPDREREGVSYDGLL